MRHRRLIYNDDGQGLSEVPKGNAKEFFREWVDKVATRVPLDTFTFCVAYPDICVYNTKVGEVYGARFKEPPNDRARTMAELAEDGTDALEVVAQRVREHDIEMLAEVRMSDTHHRKIDPNDTLCPQFTIDHPEWCIVRPDGKEETAMDYAYPEVREHRLAILRELAENYDIDGLELNFNRWAKHFHRDEGEAKAPIMTEFMGQVRTMLDEVVTQKRCRDKLILGARVPSTLKECWIAGLDVRTWVERGWLDYLIIADWNYTVPDLPVEEFAAFTRDSGCSLYVQMGDMMGGTWTGKPRIRGRGLAQFTENYHGMLLTNAEARAAAHNFYTWGADGISFWNICCNMGTKGKWASPEQNARTIGWMNEVSSPERVKQSTRHYHYLPLYKRDNILERNYAFNENGITPTGERRAQVLTFPPNEAGQRKVFKFKMADGRDGEKLAGRLRFRMLHLAPTDEIAIDINGVVVSKDKVERCHNQEDDTSETWFEINLSDCPPFQGYNELGLRLIEAAKNTHSAPYMEELEVIVVINLEI